MDSLPYAHLTNEELLRLVLDKEDLTELEQELSHRLDILMDEALRIADGDDA
jgi:hypothetical protein